MLSQHLCLGMLAMEISICLLCTSDDPAQVGRKDLEHRLVMRAIDMGGTCTGEHGIGTSKTQYLEVQLGKGAVGMMQTLKKALDPKGIMNPDKVVDMPVQ